MQAYRSQKSGRAEATDLLRAHGVSEDESVVAICPGSINSRAKRWPAEAYAALADRLIDTQRQVLLIGSKDEVDVSEEVTSRMRHQPVVLTGKTSLDQITAVLAAVDLIVTNDTGPAHIGAALGTSDDRDLWSNKSVDDAPVFAGSGDSATSAGLRAVHAARLSDRSSLHDGDHGR